MAPRFLALASRTHSRRRRAHVLGLTSLPGLECLEQRTLLSASLALYNGNYAGTYKGQSVVDNNGTTTKSTVTATAVQATITDGAITLTIPGGTGIGTVTTNGSISGTVSAQIQGGTVPVSFVGKVTSVNAAGIAASGTWSYADTVNGLEVSGQGTWTAKSAPVLTDFDANYTGTYKGSTVTTTNGKHTKSTVAATSFQSVISDGAITTTFPAGSLLTSGTGTIAANGAITGTTSFQEDGVTVTVTFNGSATRSLTGVRASGTWSFSVNLGGGSTETGSGTWSAQSVVSYNGSFAGQFSGTETVDDNGSSTTHAIGPPYIANNDTSGTISNGTLNLTIPAVAGPGSGGVATATGTVDANGNITGTVSLIIPNSGGVVATALFTGTVTQTPSGGLLISGTWTFSDVPGTTAGITFSGSGSFVLESTPAVV
jgi:hypothetical protein